MTKISLIPNRSGRREFLKRASALSAGGIATPLMLNLAALGEAAAQTANDYKALVCVFLYGANDHNNMVIPYDAASYAPYAQIRQTLARVRDTQTTAALSSTTAVDGARSFALASELAALKPIWDAGHLALNLNVGPLIQPTTKAQYSAQNVPLPPKLFSHNDQQSIWQSLASEGAVSGWGGRMGDLLASGNGASVFTSISVTGNAVYLAGKNVNQYQISTSGSVALRAKTANVFGSSQVAATLQQLVQQSGSNLLEQEHSKIVQRAISADGQLSGILAGIAQPSGFAAEPLSAQLAMVIRMLQARQSLGAKRQVFFVSLGGFDLHDFLNDLHPPLLTQVNNALASFYAALGALGLADKVTTFTASDFGRTLTSNGDGSDHGWGSHHFVMGAAVRGGRYYGRTNSAGAIEPPLYANNGPDDVGSGRLLPSLGVDQFGATLASWFGVSATDLDTVFPNLNNFTTKNLGFMV
jgi:uncharacterized protein (DUF1501 family)